MNRADLRHMAEAEQERQERFRCRIMVCAGTPCLSAGAQTVLDSLRKALAESRLDAEIEAVASGCMGPCSRGPLVKVRQQGKKEIIFERVTPELARQILLSLAKGRRPPTVSALPPDFPFLARQMKVVLANSGSINPERVEEYVAAGGYGALAHALHELTPDDVCREVSVSGLRGRGGAGYPTGVKWNLARKANGERKYVVANGDEGDPGAYMDRSIMESDPHRILEGMALAGYAIGAEQGFIYVRGEYYLAGRRLEAAIRAAERAGLLGSRVFGSNFNFRIDIRTGAGAFVCGEETSLMASIMGRRGQPRQRPPYPAQQGLWGCPTLINNVETLATVPAIMGKGGNWYAGIGSAGSKGTKVYALAGQVEIAGLIEVPMGTTLREVVFDIGGGIPGGKRFKAAQSGGPSGGCIPSGELDTPLDYESMQRVGTIMGSGGLIIMDETSCMPDVASFFLDFCRDESCGKCVPCRVGTVEMHRLLRRITGGTATMDDLAKLEELCELVGAASLCGLGMTAPNPVLSTLRYFRDEYVEHISRHRCAAGVCSMAEVPAGPEQEALLHAMGGAGEEA
ncbi:NADH dehydrogenase (quinone) [Geobacter metallireducens RCH3]|uniref:Bidirectional NAD-reducing hydrogenase, diaphorase subunit n=1 Tax=Geobacter metallireducens (strain ATCC 53774 / DSM 7210 / GS-15) TaxID=269799 RepID=Q39WM4_GEOMG|nr:NuoF family protein [Geobacter metallireducens]ABB31350.1 bidirectional NAD-reducing hydrogenase, diaphorase subunit [Geobacter metallireducens GS-15]EHP85676.1 NADH dehydrogenase (quinone) [Geobacter metallireducens RCH3]